MKRRSVLGGMLGVGAGMISGQPGTRAQGTPEAFADGDQADGSWRFLDDRGRAVYSDHPPTRIFADLQAGLSLFAYGIKPVGLVGWGGVYEIPEGLADVPFIDLEQTGSEITIEAVIAMEPDLSVGIAWTYGSATDWAGIDETTIPGFTELAPTLCILGSTQPVDVSIQRFEALAAALGADVKTAEVQAAKTAFDTACQAVRDAVAEKPGLLALAASADDQIFYLGNAQVASDLVLFHNLGLQFVELESPNMEFLGGLWQELSWEEVSNFQADLYLMDDRPYAMTREDLLAQPTFAMLPAVQAGQISSWTVEYITSYVGFTPILTTLAEAISTAEVVS